MWVTLIENKDIIKALYGDFIPELNNVYLHEIKVINGEDIQCYLRFDINALPQKLPEKWVAKKVNAVQLDINLAGAELIFFKTSGGDTVGNIDMTSFEEVKQISFKAKGKDIFIIKCKWITVRTITGYLSEQ